MKKLIFAAITLLVGLTVLAGFFFQDQLGPTLTLIFDWGLVLVAVGGLIGMGYLAAFHVRNIIQRKKGWIYSVVLLAAFLLSLVAGFVLSPQSPLYRDLILKIQIPVETSLLAILAATLLFTSLRLIRTRGWTPLTIAFMASAFLSLVFNLGLIRTASGSVGEQVLGFFQRLPMVGARGVLIGMALGGLLMGLRYLFSINSPGGER
ncbi:hypothetical protein JR338_07895 [Chloroflexota bacterium]|nr:hypothetical protein JR338_07895 [Chloroflexota bacterium]